MMPLLFKWPCLVRLQRKIWTPPILLFTLLSNALLSRLLWTFPDRNHNTRLLRSIPVAPQASSLPPPSLEAGVHSVSVPMRINHLTVLLHMPMIEVLTENTTLGGYALSIFPSPARCRIWMITTRALPTLPWISNMDLASFFLKLSLQHLLTTQTLPTLPWISSIGLASFSLRLSLQHLLAGSRMLNRAPLALLVLWITATMNCLRYSQGLLLFLRRIAAS